MTRRLAIRLVGLGAIAAAAVLLPLRAGDRSAPDPEPDDVFPADPPAGMTYVPMSIEEQRLFVENIATGLPGASGTVRTVAVADGRAPIGVRVVSLVARR